MKATNQTHYDSSPWLGVCDPPTRLFCERVLGMGFSTGTCFGHVTMMSKECYEQYLLRLKEEGK